MLMRLCILLASLGTGAARIAPGGARGVHSMAWCAIELAAPAHGQRRPARVGAAQAHMVLSPRAPRARWAPQVERRVEELRRCDGITDQMAASQSHRTITNVVRAFVTQNDTFACFLSEPLDGMQRWQMVRSPIATACALLTTALPCSLW